MAVGIIIGGAFGKIVTSLVNDIIMPPIGMLLGPVNFANLFICLHEGKFTTLEAAKNAGVPHDQLRPVHQQRFGFSDRGVLHFSGDQTDQPHEADGAGRADHQELPAVPLGNPDQGQAVHVLHVAGGRVKQRDWFLR